MTNGSELHGKVALVTGATGGVGSAIANGLATERATLALAYASNAGPAETLAAEITSGGGHAVAIGADLRSATAPEELIDAVERTLGAIDVLVANAGTGQSRRSRPSTRSCSTRRSR